jgi:formylmethanofuran dehydrogenase subunit C
MGKSLDELQRFEIYHGNQKLPLAEMFTLSGDAGDGRLNFEGNLAGVHWIGAGMSRGVVHVAGPAGRHLGSDMTGGEIHVEGDAGDWVGGEMHGGLIHVRGNAGHLIGAAYRGSRRGMTGRPGAGMRRGTIGLFGPEPTMLLPTFRRGCRYAPQFLAMTWRWLSGHAFPVPPDLLNSDLVIHHGDLLESGRGEILTRES